MTSLRRFVTVSLEDGRTMVPFAPLRNPPIANVMLLEFAVKSRDFAIGIGTAFQRTVRWLEQLDEELLEAMNRVDDDAKSDEEPGAPST